MIGGQNDTHKLSNITKFSIGDLHHHKHSENETESQYRPLKLRIPRAKHSAVVYGTHLYPLAPQNE
jgi:hypothetical protein